MNFERLSFREITLLLFLLPVLLTGRFAAAQGITTGSITGTVVDQSGAVISGAALTAANTATGATIRLTSESTGVFALHNLPIGTYTLVITAPGFEESKIEGISITAGGIAALGNIAMKVGAATTVEVQGSTAPILDTTEAEISTTFDEKQIPLLPLGGGGYDELALLQPGVAFAHADNFANTNGASIASNGQRGRSNNFELDGQNNNDNSISGPQIFFHNPDAIENLQILANNFSAQYGRNMGTVVNYVTKAGTNAFHGTAYEFYTGSWSYSLRNQDKNPLLLPPGAIPKVPRQDTNNFGGSFGGPILRDRLWFFGDGTGDRTSNGATNYTNTSLTPTPAGIQALQAAYPNNPAVAAIANFGPYAVKAGTLMSLAVQNVAVSDGKTTATIPMAGFVRTLASTNNEEEALGRLDYQMSTRDHFFVRYFYQDQLSLAGSGTVSTGGFVNVPDTAHSIGSDWTHTFGSSWANQLRYSFQQTRLFFEGGGFPQCTGNNLLACPASLSLAGGFATFGLATNLPQGRMVKEGQVQDNASWTHGRHSVTFGGEFQYQNSPNVFLPNYNGGYSYSSFNNFLQGIGSLTLGNGNALIPFQEHDYALYVQDDWKLLSRLTLNLGLRWEYFGQAVNLLHSETVKQQTGPNPFWNTSLPLSITTYPETNPNYKNFEPRVGFAWTPAMFNDRVVVRGGYAIGDDPAFYNIFLNSATAAPVINLGTFACGGAAPQCLPSSGINGAAVRSLNLSQIPTGGNPGSRSYTNNPPNFYNPYSQSYTLGVQYEIRRAVVVETRYVGNHASRLFQSIDSNPNLLPVATAFPNFISASSLCNDPGQFDNGRLHCGLGNVRTRANTAFSNYNGLQLNARTNQWHGLTSTVSYTWSRSIDNSSEIFGTSSAGQAVPFAQNPLNIDQGERGQGGNNYPNLASAGVTYQVPTPSWAQSGWRKRAVAGFSLSGIYLYDDGQPYTPFQFRAPSPKNAVTCPTGDPNCVQSATTGKYALTAAASQSFCDGGSSGAGFNAAFVTYDACRPILANSKAPLATVGINDGTGTYHDYYTGDVASRSAFHWLWNNQAEALALGNPYPGVGRNTLRGQSNNNLDANIYKTTNITERTSLQLQLNVFNVFNRQYRGSPDNYLEDYTLQGNYGLTPFTSTALVSSGRRSAQLGAKFIF